MNTWLNMTVRLRDDPRSPTGRVIGRVLRGANTLYRVQWESGVIEFVHPSELVKYDGLLQPGESPRQGRDRINGFKGD